MKGRKYVVVLISIFLVSACGNKYGHQVVGDQLTVYYETEDLQELAKNTAFFWKENGLVTEKKQDLQLVRNQQQIELRLIAVDPKAAKNMSFNERKLLLDLQRKMNTYLQVSNVEIVICNARFEPVYNINE